MIAIQPSHTAEVNVLPMQAQLARMDLSCRAGMHSPICMIGVACAPETLRNPGTGEGSTQHTTQLLICLASATDCSTQVDAAGVSILKLLQSAPVMSVS